MSQDNAAPSLEYVLGLGDNAMVLGQRLSEWVRFAPTLEEEMALANFALDYVGQARMFYGYAGEIEAGTGASARGEDDYAFLREVLDYRNLLLLEQPNGHFGDTIVRQVLFNAFYVLQLRALGECRCPRLQEIAVRIEKEVAYHLRHAANWLVRLGDGTELSHQRVSDSLNTLWRFTGEMFTPTDAEAAAVDQIGAPDLSTLRGPWLESLSAILSRATLAVPENDWMDGGGKRGEHSEHLGYLLAEMQSLHRAHPGASW